MTVRVVLVTRDLADQRAGELALINWNVCHPISAKNDSRRNRHYTPQNVVCSTERGAMHQGSISSDQSHHRHDDKAA